MAFWENGAEGGDDGVAVTTGNSASTGNAFSIVNINSGGSITYSTAQAVFGDTSYHVTAPNGGTALARWSQTSTTLRFRGYIRFASFPASSATNFLQLRANTTATGCGLQVRADGMIVWVDAGGGSGNVHTISLNTWYMISMMVTRGTTSSDGYVKVEIRNVSGATVLATYESSTRNTGTEDLTFAQFGKLTGSNPEVSMYFDQVAFDIDTGAMIGPYESGEPQLNISQSAYYVVDATASAPGTGGTLSFSATRVSGPTLTVIQPIAGMLFFTQDTSAASVYTITVTETGVGTDSKQVTIPAGTVATETVNNSAPLFPASSSPGSSWN